MNFGRTTNRLTVYNEDGCQIFVDRIEKVPDGGWEISGEWHDRDGNKIRADRVTVDFDPMMFISMMGMNGKRAMQLIGDMVHGLFRGSKRKVPR